MTLVLYILSGKEVGRVERFEQREVLIGRAEGADLHLPHPGISRRHARLVRQSEQSVLLQDLDSTSGTFLDGERVPRVLLSDGAIFRLADIELRLRIETLAPPTSGPAQAEADEVVLEGDWEQGAPGPAAVRPAAAPEPPKRPTTPIPVPTQPPELSPLEEARRAHRKAKPTPGGKPVLQYAHTAGDSGWARGDLAQRPGWQRGLIGLIALALLAALAYGSFQLTQGLREARQQPDVSEAP